MSLSCLAFAYIQIDSIIKINYITGNKVDNCTIHVLRNVDWIHGLCDDGMIFGLCSGLKRILCINTRCIIDVVKNVANVG